MEAAAETAAWLYDKYPYIKAYLDGPKSLEELQRAVGTPQKGTEVHHIVEQTPDAYFDGDLGRRRRAKFVPGGIAKTFIQTKEPELKGPFDEWLARIVCFAFSISPQALTQTVNRATAETQKELAEEEGLAPILAWAKALIDDILAGEFDAPDLEFVWSESHETDPATQETILSGYASKGILTINEARAALGRAPLAEASADRPMTLTNAGFVALPE